tara:strand:- start:1509 stop:1898 length:390 start_codon:yes stop_codon:yes gene_type:complete
MKNYKNNNKRNRFRSNGDRNFQRNNNIKIITDFTNGSNFKRKNQTRNNVNLSKLIEKYTNFAREALSNGDKILSENYLQHADHFTRMQVEKEGLKKNNETNTSSNNVYSNSEKIEDVNKKNDQDQNIEN